MAGKACVFRRKPKGRLKIGREPRARGRRCILVHMKEQKTNRSAQKTLPERSDTFAPSAQASTGRRAASGFKGTFRGVILYDPNFVRRNENGGWWPVVALPATPLATSPALRPRFAEEQAASSTCPRCWLVHQPRKSSLVSRRTRHSACQGCSPSCQDGDADGSLYRSPKVYPFPKCK